LNPLTSGFGGTLSNGNLDYSLGSGTKRAEGTIAVTSGKWWWEALAISGTTSGTVGGRFGFCVQSSLNDPELTVFGLVWHATNGVYRVLSGSFTLLSGTNYNDNDLLACALNADANIAYFYKNGALVYTYDFSSFVAVGSAPLTPHCWNASSGSPVWTYNFGQRPFAYPAPSGFKALCTQNLTDPVVAQPSTVFDVLLWSGSGTGTDKTISGLNFADGPDLVWAKARNTNYHNNLYDSVRGYGQRNALVSDQTYNEGNAYSGRIKSTNSTSITWENDGGSLWYDGSGLTYVAWCWDAGSSTVSNTQGSIPGGSQVRANTSAGFSIVTYTGPGPSNNTVGHGLGVAPELIITKNRDRSIYWVVYTKTTGKDAFLRLNTTDASTSSSNIWGTATPTSTVFGGVGTDLSNGYVAGEKIVSYCFAPVAGYSSFGSYTGNGIADGPFVFTGFRPKFVLARCSAIGADWWIYDSARGAYNVNYAGMRPNLANQETTDAQFDFLSNGFKLRTVGTDLNSNGNTHIYAAFAEAPFKTARAR
jgi:hypothetical protein